MSLVATYMAKQIIKGNLHYDIVVTKYPQYKEEIDEYLKAHGYNFEEG